MNIAGILVYSKPEFIEQVRNNLEGFSEITVHSVTDSGQLIITVETDTDSQLTQRINEMEYISGVTCALVIYHHFESKETLEESAL